MAIAEIDRQVESLSPDNLAKYFVYDHLATKKEVKSAFYQDEMVKRFINLAQDKLLTPLQEFPQQKHFLTRVSLISLDLLKEISLQRMSTFGLFSQMSFYSRSSVSEGNRVFKERYTRGLKL